jgi:hypothetical protein
VTVVITRDTPVIHVAAMYGTNPVVLERDNPLLATYSRALNGNSSDGTAVGLLAVKKGCILAVRPAEGIEARRFNPSGKARKGAQPHQYCLAPAACAQLMALGMHPPQPVWLTMLIFLMAFVYGIRRACVAES